jgi:hypothetical protein
MKNFLKCIFFAFIVLFIFIDTTQDAPLLLDWRFNEFRRRGIKVEEVFEVKCILGYYYHIWTENLIGIPVLNNQEERIKCVDNI